MTRIVVYKRSQLLLLLLLANVFALSQLTSADTDSGTGTGTGGYEIGNQIASRNDDTDLQLAKAAVYVIERFISPKLNMLVIMEKCHERQQQQQQQDYHYELLNYTLRNLNSTISVQLNMDTANKEFWDYNVFIVDSLQAFRKLRFAYPSTLYDREFYFLILLTARNVEAHTLRRIIREIFETCLHYNVIYVVLMVSEADCVMFYSYKLYGQHCDQEVYVYRRNRWHAAQLAHDNLFPRRIKNLNNCPLNVGWYALPPFAMYDDQLPQASGSHDALSAEHLKGIDGQLLQIIANVLRFRINLLPPCEKSLINEDGNMTGCFHELQHGIADIVVGALSGSHLMRNYFSSSVAYHQSAYVFVVRVDHTFGPIAHLIKPFKNFVWFFIGGTLVFGILVQRLISGAHKQQQLHKCFMATARNGKLNLLTTLLGNPLEARQLPCCTLARTFFANWLLLTLVLRSAYQGKLFDVFRMPCFTPLPPHISDLLAQNYTLLAAEYFDFYPKNATVLVDGSYLARFELLQQMPDTRLTTTALMANLAHYNKLYWKTSRLADVREPIYMYQLVMYMRKHSILKFYFDDKLKQLMSAGIISYISQQDELRRLHFFKSYLRTVPKIHLPMLTGLFTIYFVMLSFAFIMFLLELLSVKLFARLTTN